MQPFDLLTPTSLTEAVNLLSESGGAALPLAGGTDLIPQMRAGEASPGSLLSLRRLRELDDLAFDPGRGLRLGARVTLRQLVRDPMIRRYYPVLAEAASIMASEQVRSLATVGGNLCNGSPSADLAPPLLVLDAEVVLVGPSGQRTLPVGEFFVGPGATARRPNELLLELRLPPPRGSAIYLKHTPRSYMDLAVVGVAARLVRGNGSPPQIAIALGAVAPVPMRADRAEQSWVGEGLTPAGLARAARSAAEECSPIDDIRASAGYRRQMIEVLVRRSLETLLDDEGPR